MNDTAELTALAARLDQVTAIAQAQAALIRVLTTRTLIASGDRWPDALSDLAQATRFDIEAMHIDDDPQRAAVLRGMAQDSAAACLRDLSAMMEQYDALGRPPIMPAGVNLARTRRRT